MGSFSPRGDDVRKGRVVKINQRGFGLLQVDGESRDVWFHSNDIVGANIDIRQLREDDEIECKLQPSQKIRGNFEAIEVRPLDLDLVEGREMKGRRPSPGRGRDRGRRSRSRSRGRRRRSYSPPVADAIALGRAPHAAEDAIKQANTRKLFLNPDPH